MEININEGLNNRVISIACGDDNNEDLLFELKMLSENEIPVFIKCRERCLEGKRTLEYDVSSMTSLKVLAGKIPLGYQEVRLLISSLQECMETIDKYLLSEEGLILDPEYVFYDKNDKRIRFCFFPWHDVDVFTSYSKISEFLLESIDYEDESAVKAAYDIYACVLNKDYSFEKVLPRGVPNEEEIIENRNSEVTENGDNGGKESEDAVVCSRYDEAKYVKNTPKRLSTLSVVCITLQVAMAVFLTLLYMFSKRMFFGIFGNIKVISITVLIASVLAMIPITNISDIRRSKRLYRTL